MKKKIGRKLFQQMVTMLLLIAMIAIAGLVCIQVLKRTSNKIVVEYLELNAIQNLKYSFHLMTDSAHDFLLFKRAKDRQNFLQQANITQVYLQNLKRTLSESHSQVLLIQFETHLQIFRDRVYNSPQGSFTSREILQLIDEADLLIEQANKDLDKLFVETKQEINEYIAINKASALHSSITIILLAFLLIVSSYFWGAAFVRKTTRAIELLVQSTIKAAAGDLSVRAENISQDEIGDLANSFNRMIETLDKTTVSRDYFDNILRSMFDMVVVTDKNGKIRSLNQATLDLLDYKENELVNQPVTLLFQEGIGTNGEKDDPVCLDLILKDTNFSQEKSYRTKEGVAIPVLFSCSAFKDEDERNDGFVFVAHDISERVRIRKELERTQWERIIAINEAQEEERVRIAREIHDGLGQMLTGISYSIDNYFAEQFKESNQLQTKVLMLHEQIDTAIQESKSIAYDLIPILLKDFGLVVAVKNLVEEVREQCKINIRFDAFKYRNRLDERLEKMLYRVIQEALNNIQKHSRAANAIIQIVRHEDLLSLTIEDDGVGVDSNELKEGSSKGGIGLMSMRERVLAFNGTFVIHSSLNKGFEIMIDIPLN